MSRNWDAIFLWEVKFNSVYDMLMNSVSILGLTQELNVATLLSISNLDNAVYLKLLIFNKK